MNPLALQDLDNEVLKEADQYLRDHKILELFEVSYSFQSLVQNHFNHSNTLMTFFVLKMAVTYDLNIGSDDSALLQAARQRGGILDRAD